MLLTVSLFPFMLGHLNILDTPLTFFVCSAIWVGYLALQHQKNALLLVLFFLCSGFFDEGNDRYCFSIRNFDDLVDWNRTVASNIETFVSRWNYHFPDCCLSLVDSSAKRKYRLFVVFLCP